MQTKKNWQSKPTDKYAITEEMCPPTSNCARLKIYHSGTAIARMTTTVKMYALTFLVSLKLRSLMCLV